MRLGPLPLLAALCACTEPAPEMVVDDEPSPIDEACVIEGPGPTTIDELVERLDALPHPVTIPCVLASFPRPLTLAATTGEFSVQPADGPDNPRLFVFSEDLILSVVPVGEGRKLLEFSEALSSTHTIKGELAFPITEALDPDAPYDLEFDDQMTRCAICHGDEYELADRPGVFASHPIRPTTDTLVPVDTLDAVLDACDWTEDPERCAILSSLLDYGEVQQGEFPSEFPTIFD